LRHRRGWRLRPLLLLRRAGPLNRGLLPGRPAGPGDPGHAPRRPGRSRPAPGLEPRRAGPGSRRRTGAGQERPRLRQGDDARRGLRVWRRDERAPLFPRVRLCRLGHDPLAADRQPGLHQRAQPGRPGRGARAQVPVQRRDQLPRGRRQGGGGAGDGPLRRAVAGAGPHRRHQRRLRRLALQPAQFQHRAAAAAERRGPRRRGAAARAHRGNLAAALGLTWKPMNDLLPVLLSGGSGTRLWPLSRESYPKQFLPLHGELTMLQETWRRVAPLATRAPLVVANEAHRFVAAEQLHQVGAVPQAILLEPAGRNTAPAIAVAALEAGAGGEDPVLLVLPSDHVVRDPEAFRRAVLEALPAAEAGHLVTFGIVPTGPETGYG